ncbi:fibronectin type III domain-containing protein [Patescibacteria group bacterium]|nr:fibronectin type III domain-containing protein [Patescibacteria group bacterium]
MGIKTQKVLRLISKIILILVGVGLVGIAGYYVYKSIAFKPQNVVVTNVTDGSATVTWTTASPMKGIVYVKKDKGLLPGPLGIIGSSMAYDDRDVSDAQKACVETFNKKASETKDSTFSVSGSNFDCENVKVTKIGSYYTHSVTVTNLDENSTYNFVVGDGIWSFKESVSTVKTFSVLDTVGEPMPVFGKITGDDGTYSRDGLVYITFRDGSEQTDSIVYSSAVNDEGGWYVDASAIRDVDGNVLPLELSNDSFVIKGIYSNYGRSEEELHIFGVFEVDTFDITVKKQIVKSSLWDWLVSKAYAGETCGYVNGSLMCGTTTGSMDSWHEPNASNTDTLLENAGTLGYGHVMQAIAGLDGDSSLSVAEQNLLTGNSVMSSEVGYITGQQNIPVEEAPCTECSNSNSETSSTNETGNISAIACNVNPNSANCELYCIKHPNASVCKEKEDLENGDVESNAAVQNTHQCVVVPEYSGSYIADIGSDAGREYQTLRSCSACGVSVGTMACINTYGVPNVKYVDETAGEYNVSISELNKVKLLAAQEDNGVSILNGNPTMKSAIIEELEKIYSDSERIENVGSDETVIGIGMGYQKKVTVYCEALGLDLVSATGGGKMCDLSSDSSRILTPFSIVGKAYASESTEYALFLPEMGIYSFELGNYTVTTEVTDGKTRYLFYVETNNESGFQMPVDPDNPTVDEDIVLSSSAYEITYTQESTAQQYEIKKGINIISFNFVPVSTDSGAYTAKDVISQASTNGVEIQYISTFEGGRWNNGYSCSSDTCTGNNFTIVPGKGYLVYATDDGTVTIPGYNLTSSVPVAFSAGWNLIGVHGYTTAYTARSFIDSINKVEGLTANNVSWWPTSKSKYEGLQVDSGTQYGLDFSVSPTNGYFVRISSFKPSDTACKSLIWQPGGTLNGTCGNTK